MKLKSRDLTIKHEIFLVHSNRGANVGDKYEREITPTRVLQVWELGLDL